MLIDSHCHFDAAVFDGKRDALYAQAQALGVRSIIVPAVEVANFELVAKLAQQYSGVVYTLGIHPMYIEQSEEGDLSLLREAVVEAIADPRFVGIGEIGLDFFVESIAEGEARAKQEHYFNEQLKLAQEFELPVILHVRRSQDIILKYLRRYPKLRGIAHAFNGSQQQAEQFIALGYLLGFGGAMTFARARQIRAHAARYDIAHYALETDAPDIPPSWLDSGEANTPAEVARMAEVFAELRGVDVATVHKQTGENVLHTFPRLQQYLMTLSH